MKELYYALFCVAVKHWSVTLRSGDMRFTNFEESDMEFLTKEKHREMCSLNKFL